MFITFEGLDGSGKTTQFKTAVTWLREHGLDVLTLREPGGTRIGDQIREILHNRVHTEMDARAELLLYAASRAQLVSECIQPHLQAGGVVLCDRYADSTLAYQGYARGLDLAFLNTLIQFATQGIKPDLTLYLDVEPEVGLGRRLDGQGEINRLDVENLDFHRRVYQGYQALIVQEPKRWVSIQADRPITDVAQQIRAVLEMRLKLTAV